MLALMMSSESLFLYLKYLICPLSSNCFQYCPRGITTVEIA